MSFGKMDKKKDEGFYPSCDKGRAIFEEYELWKVEDAIEANSVWRNNEYQIENFEKCPLLQWHCVKELRFIYEHRMNEERVDVLRALHLCFHHDLPIPEWCKTYFKNSYERVSSFNARSWDDVFGRPHPKGTNLGAKRKKHNLSFAVYKRISEIKCDKPNIAIDASLFENVGREFNLGKTLTEEYYYSIKEHMPSL